MHEAHDAADTGDTQRALQLAREIEADWQRSEAFFFVFIAHNELENMQVSVRELVPSIEEGENAAFLEKCRSCIYALEYIQNNEKLTWQNLL